MESIRDRASCGRMRNRAGWMNTVNTVREGGGWSGEEAAGYNGRVLLALRAIRLETISDIHLLRGSTPRSDGTERNGRGRKGTEGTQTRRVAYVYERT